jgi:hypothetical protein
MSPTIWYCPPVPSQCSAIYSSCFSLWARLYLSSWCRKGLTMLRSSSSSLKLDGTCWYIHNSLPSHYNSLCFCKFFVPESPQVHSIIPNHWTTYWPNLTQNTMCWLPSASHIHLNWLVWACWLPWSKDTIQWQVTVTGKCLCCETNTCQTAEICLSLCFSRLSLVLCNRLQSLLSFWLVFSPVMTGLATLWNRPKVMFCLTKVF